MSSMAIIIITSAIGFSLWLFAKPPKEHEQ